MELSKEWGTIFIETGQELKGYTSRIFKAKVVTGLGKGGQRRAEEDLGWNRGTIRKGMAELAGNFAYLVWRNTLSVSLLFPTQFLDDYFFGTALAFMLGNPTAAKRRFWLSDGTSAGGVQTAI